MVDLRLARPPDVPDLERIAVAAYRRYVPLIGREPAPMVADYARPVGAGQVTVAVDQGVVLGFIVLVRGPDHLLVENVAVLPAAQGRGIGGHLMDLAEAEAVRLGLGAVTLYTNEAMLANLALYARRGYVETRRGEEDGFRRVYLRKHIDRRGGPTSTNPC